MKESLGITIPAEEMTRLVRNAREDVERVMAEKLKEEGISAMIKHEVEEVIWRTIENSTKQISGAIANRIAEKATVGNIEEEARKAIKGRIDEVISSQRGKRNVEEVVMDVAREETERRASMLETELTQLVEEKRREVANKYEDIVGEVGKKATSYLEKEISELVKQQLGILYDEVKRFGQRLERLEWETVGKASS